MAAKLINVHQLDLESIQKEYKINERTQKTITFIYPLIQDGLLGSMIKFPHAGTIIEVDAFCVTAGVEDTVIDIERISESDFENNQNTWKSIFENNRITIPANSNKQDGLYNLSFNTVNKNDVFRVNFLHTGVIATPIDNLKISDLTIQIKISI